MKNAVKILLFLILPLSAFSQESFSSFREKGNKSLDDQKYQEAVSFFLKAIELGTENKADLAWTSSIAAICALQIKDTTNAIFFFETAIKNNCNQEDIYERFLNLAQQRNDLNREEIILKQAGKNIAEGGNKYTIKLLNFYFNNKFYEKAILLADQPLSASINPEQVIVLKAHALIKTGKSNEAIQILEKFNVDHPDSFESLKQLGLICYEKAYALNLKAKNDYKKLIKPSMSDYNNYLARGKSTTEDFKRALPYLEKAYQIKADGIVKNVLYNTYIKLGNKEKASKYK